MGETLFTCCGALRRVRSWSSKKTSRCSSLFFTSPATFDFHSSLSLGDTPHSLPTSARCSLTYPSRSRWPRWHAQQHFLRRFWRRTGDNRPRAL